MLTRFYYHCILGNVLYIRLVFNTAIILLICYKRCRSWARAKEMVIRHNQRRIYLVEIENQIAMKNLYKSIYELAEESGMPAHEIRTQLSDRFGIDI